MNRPKGVEVRVGCIAHWTACGRILLAVGLLAVALLSPGIVQAQVVVVANGSPITELDIPEDGPAAFYRTLCREFEQRSPANWPGFVADTPVLAAVQA